MNKQCTGCVVSAGTHKPAEALHQEIAEPQADAMRGNTAGGVRCHDADACAMGQLPCPTPGACGCAPAPQAVQAAVPDGWRDQLEQALCDLQTSPYPATAVAVKRIEKLLAAAPAHPADGVPAQCPNINEPRGCWRVACQLGGKCREPERSATQPAAQGMDALTIVEKLPRYTYGYKSDEWGMNRCLRAYQDNAGTFLMRDEVLAALAAKAAKQGEKP